MEKGLREKIDYIYKYLRRQKTSSTVGAEIILATVPIFYGFAGSAEDGIPVDGIIYTDRIAGTFIATDIRLSLTSADTSATLSVDVLKNGVSILATPVTIDATEETSVTSSVPFVFTGSATSITFADNDEIQFVLSGTPTDAVGLKGKIIGSNG